ncbi:MAG: S26 family signal peptidase [Clostridia bacterium]|nr:S26 family signal peptidase [Clostridia bacterium]
MTKAQGKRLGGILLNALFAVFLAVCTLAAVLLLSAKRDAYGAAELFGYRFFVVTSESMERCELTPTEGYPIGAIPKRSMVIVDSVPEDEAAAKAWYASLQIGDVLTFRYVYDTQVTITHRLTAIRENGSGGYVLELMGDNRSTDADLLCQTIDTSRGNSGNYVIGRVCGQCYPLGVLISLLKSRAGIIGIVIVPCAIIIILEVIKLFSLRSAAKQERTEAELLALRRRLAELEGEGNGEGNNEGGPH